MDARTGGEEARVEPEDRRECPFIDMAGVMGDEGAGDNEAGLGWSDRCKELSEGKAESRSSLDAWPWSWVVCSVCDRRRSGESSRMVGESGEDGVAGVVVQIQCHEKDMLHLCGGGGGLRYVVLAQLWEDKNEDERAKAASRDRA